MLPVEYIGWEPYLDPHRDDPYCDESEADDEQVEDVEEFEYDLEWDDDEQEAQHDA